MPAQRLLIPDIGTKLVLAEDWTFRLHWERRNESLWKALGLIQQEQVPRTRWTPGQRTPVPGGYTYRDGYYEEVPGEFTKVWGKPEGFDPKDPDNGYGKFFRVVTAPAGTVLGVQRVYIRNGGKVLASYSSVTFGCKKVKGSKFHGRFWAKLSDVNNMVCEIDEDTLANN